MSYPEKKLTHKEELAMYYLRTPKQQKYFSEVIRLHYEKGYGEDRITQLLPIGHSTVSRWIAIFAREKGNISGQISMQKPQETRSTGNVDSSNDDLSTLQKRVRELERQLLLAEIKAEAYER